MNFRNSIPRFFLFFYRKIFDYFRQKQVIFNGTSFKVQLTARSYGLKNKVTIGKNSNIMNSYVKFYGSNASLVIGENCIIKNVTFWFEGNEGIIKIGNNVTIEEAHISVVDNKKVIIGNDCMLSSGILITTTDSHSIVDFNGNRLNPDKNVELKDHVWLGANVKILKGAIIGNNTIIGAESLVTKSISSNCLAVGIPAKVIKTNVNWNRERL